MTLSSLFCIKDSDCAHYSYGKTESQTTYVTGSKSYSYQEVEDSVFNFLNLNPGFFMLQHSASSGSFISAFYSN